MAPSLNVNYRKPVMLFYDTKPRDIEATWWQGTPLRKVPFPAWVRKPLAVASKLGYSNFLCTCLGTQSMTKLNQKLAKTQKTLDTDIYTKEKYLCKNLGVKAVGGICSKWAYFGNLWYKHTLGNLTHCICRVHLLWWCLPSEKKIFFNKYGTV